jgi:hypothetical protein
MKIYNHRTKNVVVIKCETQAEKSALCRYPKNIGLQATTDDLTFFASTSQISDFEEFKKEVLK